MGCLANPLEKVQNLSPNRISSIPYSKFGDDMTNFQLIEAYDVDIENFSYDVADMVDSIYVGPQGELLETIESFNHTYGAKIGVTKNFTLKPGGYDEIKQAYNRWVLR